MKRKNTRKKTYAVIGWVVYILSMIIGIIGYVEIALIGFLSSYMILFLWSVHYQIPQLDKGVMMILTGTFFVVVLSAIAGLEVNDSRILLVPEQMKMSFVALVTIAGATFFGAGGSVIANVASEHSSDSPVSIKNEDRLSLSNVEAKLAKIQQLMWWIILLVIISVVFLGCLIGYLHK